MATFTIFYSWQSDSPTETNKNLIRHALRSAATRLEAEYSKDDLHVIVDEATRNVSGSPNIPQTIFEKIGAADIFVGDVSTTMRLDTPRPRASPNPNVCVELGYAIAKVGWGRILLLFNDAYGSFPSDAPFDFDRHRMSKYSLPESALTEVQGSKKERAIKTEQLKKPLFDLVYEAIALILKQSPSKPGNDLVRPDQVRRDRDVEALRTILEFIHVPTMDEFFSELQAGYCLRRIFVFWKGFDSVCSSALFYFYDSHLGRLITQFHDAWGRSLSFGAHFRGREWLSRSSFVHEDARRGIDRIAKA